MLAGSVSNCLDHYIGQQTSPVAVAYSGGGDSTALLHLVIQWAKDRQQGKVHALIVDHGLQKGSHLTAKRALRQARALGAQGQILTWAGTKPKTAVQEQARLARYDLLGQACRALGATHCLLGHTQSDQVETVFMRLDAGSGWRGLAAMPPWANAPLWPMLHGVNIVRPLLSHTRADIMAYYQTHALDYIDDPANADLAYGRVRARQYLAENPDLARRLLAVQRAARRRLEAEQIAVHDFLREHATVLPWGGIALNVQSTHAIDTTSVQALRRVIQVASGSALMPDTEKTRALLTDILSGGFRGKTLGGAMVKTNRNTLVIGRDPGAVLGRGKQAGILPVPIKAGQQTVWDGRYLIRADQDGDIMPLGEDAIVSPDSPLKIGEHSRPFRATLPGLKRVKDGEFFTPRFGGATDVNIGEGMTVYPLAASRLVGLDNRLETLSQEFCQKGLNFA